MTLTRHAVLNIVLVFFGVLGIGAATFFGYVIAVAYESDNIEPGGLISYMLIPSEIRGLSTIQQCSPKRYLRNFQECGGICGEYVGVMYGTTASLDDLKARYQMTPLLAATGYTEGRIRLIPDWPGDPANCPRALIEIYDDYRIPR